MMLPILISVSVAPMSYFFCASAELPVAASNARAAEKAPNRKWIAGILISLGSRWNVSWFLDLERLAAVGSIEYLSPVPGNKKPPRRGRGGPVFSRMPGRTARGAEYFKAFSSEVGTGSHSNPACADCVDLSAVENASKQKARATRPGDSRCRAPPAGTADWRDRARSCAAGGWI